MTLPFPRPAFIHSIAVMAALSVGHHAFERHILAQTSGKTASGIPRFEVDPSWQWPPKLPNNWGVGIVSFVAVDRHDHVWALHRYRQVPAGQPAAPPVLEFDASGKFVQGWGGFAPGYDWPETEHGLSVDHQDNVWITGMNPREGQRNSKPTERTDDMILKFTNKGKFLAQFGGRDRHPPRTSGSQDTTSVHAATEATVYPKTNELFVSDGYDNRRVLVLDAQTLAFKRMWGAFGATPPPQVGPNQREEPIDLKKNPEGPKVWNSVHGIRVSNDGLVYVCDRNHRRIQVFTLAGKYVAQVFVNPEEMSKPHDGAEASQRTAGSLALSADPEQRFIFVGDYGNGHIHIVDRKALRVVGQFGQLNAKPGNFLGLHALAVDSKGNLWSAETQPRPVGSRIQRFIFKGVS
jgi:DNA-binding beta-propeller fold protein YncE